MGLAKIYSRAIKGTKADEVIVEVHVANGLPSFSIVGLPDVEVKESRDRVRSAIQMSGFDFPARRITVNLAPADLPKESGSYDLPIAIGILIASGLIKTSFNLENYEFAGELALDGNLRKITGTLAFAYNTSINKRSLILPIMNASEALLVENSKIYAINNLLDIIKHLTNEQTLEYYVDQSLQNLEYDYYASSGLDLSDVKGQVLAKKALEIAASGRHSMLMIGNPGCGKSMLANRIMTIMPLLNNIEAIETASIYSISNTNFELKQWRQMPFRQPHHSSSGVAIVGGGSNPRPGEISLAHNGVLFLDEIPEFEKKVLELLREPLETRKINIARATSKVEFPANFQLIAAMNPCPCGYLNHVTILCKCTPDQVKRYVSKLSGPLLDRIDLLVHVPNLKSDELQSKVPQTSSKEIKEKVLMARSIQLKRQNKLNFELNNNELENYCNMDEKATTLLTTASEKLGLSARTYHRLIKIARTIADLDTTITINASHIAQSLQYRVYL